MSFRRVAGPAALALVAACGGGGGSNAPSPLRTVDLGGGVVVTLGRDGSVVVSRDGKTVVQTPKGVPLLSRVADADRPDAWHDPTRPPGSPFVPVDPAALSIDGSTDGSTHEAHIVLPAQPADTALVSLALASDDGFYGGLGERYDHADARGAVVPMFLAIDGDFESGTNDAHVPVPFFVSSKGYGVFVASRQAGAFDVAAADPGVVRATFEGRSLDVTIFVDPDPLAVAAAFARKAGLARVTPSWALSPMMWRHVDTQAELLSDLAQIRSLHVPTSTFWVDDGWEVARNSFDFDPVKFPDPTGLLSTMRALGFELLGWSTPYLEKPTSAPPDEAQTLYMQAAGSGYFVENGDGAPFAASGPGAAFGYGMIDFTNPQARAFWAGLAGKAVAVGMNGFKLDYGEDMVPDLLGARLDLKLFDGETERTARTYPLGYHGGYRDALAASSDGGVLIVRASTYGGASVADIVWPGDLDNGFEHRGDTDPSGTLLVGGLPASILAGVTLGASGFPLYGADTGGYRHGAPTKEALIRWAEHTALSMVMQLGPGEDKYPWNYDAETVSLYSTLASLHQRLTPYLAAVLAGAEAVGTPTLRALPLAYPSDGAAAAHADDEYLLGPDLLVAPVVAAGAGSRDVHLPPGRWVHYWSDQVFDGPADVTVFAPLGQPALFARAGALVPLLPDGIDTVVAATDPGTVSLAQHATEIEAQAWVLGPSVQTMLDDGGTMTVADDGSAVTVTWAPGSVRTQLTIDLDLNARGASGLTRVATVAGAPLAPVTGEAAVRASPSSAWAIDPSRGHAWLRFVGAGTARLSP